MLLAREGLLRQLQFVKLCCILALCKLCALCWQFMTVNIRLRLENVVRRHRNKMNLRSFCIVTATNSRARVFQSKYGRKLDVNLKEKKQQLWGTNFLCWLNQFWTRAKNQPDKEIKNLRAVELCLLIAQKALCQLTVRVQFETYKTKLDLSL